MTNKREQFPHYIGINKDEQQAMLKSLGLNSLDDLYQHIPNDVKLDELKIENAIERETLKKRITELANKNNIRTSFIGDGLEDFEVPQVTYSVSKIRGLTTAYTPYQPERSQGTLQSLWIYQNLISKLTGFEAINASLYERSTCLFEALNCASRIAKKDQVIVADSIYPGDKEVIDTLAKETNLEIIYAPIDKKTSLLDTKALEALIGESTAAIAFPQINSFGIVENFNELTKFAHEKGILVIALADLHALSDNGLAEPATWGERGADLLVAEGQSLCLAPNYGGPGLGIFGVRYNENNKTFIRSTAGRYIGKAKDIQGRDCKAIILSTREQHIRREKATSNICSNQSFIATLCGAALLEKGSTGLQDDFTKANQIARQIANELTTLEGVDLKFGGAVFNKLCLKLNCNVAELIKEAIEADLHIGVNISGRCGIDEQLLLITTSNRHTAHDTHKLVRFFKKFFKQGSISNSLKSIPPHQQRKTQTNIHKMQPQEITEYYQKLGKQNLSPDEGLYPLGSCTMKYNPELNEWAAGLNQFTQTHPQAPEADTQGNLQLMYEIQEIFKAITGLPAVTTQPVAGAQGELVGIKMFQAYHRDHNPTQPRDVILIPRSAHGTNPATATMAGYEVKKVDGKQVGIVSLDASECGQINFEQFEKVLAEYGNRIAGIMITNPNTAGIFETNFKKIADALHEVDALVYMDGANMNAIAGWVDLSKMGVDAVHNNLHKTWSIPHGGGGPGDAIVAVSEKLQDYLPGLQFVKEKDHYKSVRPLKSIGSFHRHHGNFAHKVRAYTYLKYLGADGIKRMSAIAVLSARYLYHKLKQTYPTLPTNAQETPRMHEFILTISEDSFTRLAGAGTPKAQAIGRIGKLFLDLGFHAPTVAFPEQYGLMLEPTESFTKDELDGFTEVVETIHHIINEYPQVLQTVPHFTPIDRVEEVGANKTPVLSEKNFKLDEIIEDRIPAEKLRNLTKDQIISEILKAHEIKLNA